MAGCKRRRVLGLDGGARLQKATSGPGSGGLSQLLRPTGAQTSHVELASHVLRAMFLRVRWSSAPLHHALSRRHQTCDFREHCTSAPAELGGKIHNISRNRDRTQVLLQARKLHVYGSGTFGAFWKI